MNRHLYLLVADDGRARIFQAQTPVRTLTPVYDECHSEGLKKPAELYSDRPGRQQSDFGGSHSFAGERKSHEEESYARGLCELLDKAHRDGSFDTLVLMAAPHLLGELRKHLSHDCAKVLLNSHHKDLVKSPDKDILATLLKGNPELGDSASAAR